MNETTRERDLVEAFGRLAHTLVADYDVLDLLQHLVETCKDLFAVDEVGLLLADPDADALDVVASTSEEVRTVEVMQLSAEAGPCIQAFRTGEQVSVPDIAASPWERFRESAAEQGFRSVAAIPLRLGRGAIGAINLFGHRTGVLPERDLQAVQALADVATIGILHSRTVEAGDLVRRQLQAALNSRIVIEQAKGVLAQTHRIGTDEAFTRLRDYARSNRLQLAEVARRLVDRSLIF